MPSLRELAIAGVSLGLVACSSSATKDLGPCGNGRDGCISVGVTNADPAPYGAENPDGKGRIYLALIDSCPAPARQFTFVADIVIVDDADLTTDATYRAPVSYSFNDARFAQRYAAGEMAYLSGFLDDNETTPDPSTAFPDNGDTLLSCVPVTLNPGSSQRASPLMPCVLQRPPPPYVFQGSTECDAYAPFLAMIPDAGTDGGGEAGAAGN